MLHRLIAVVAVLSFSIGFISSLHARTAEAQSLSNFMIRWMASPAANFSYCFGVLGWHQPGNGTAADVFADSAAPCNDPDGASNVTHAISYGAAASATNLLGVAYDMQDSICFRSGVDMHQHNGVAWILSGTERWTHVQYSQPSAQYYTIPLGGAWSWQLAQVTLGNTRFPDKTPGCETTAFHSHQVTCRFPGTHALSEVRNTTLVTNTIYLQHDLNRYIHKWDWNTAPSSTRPWHC